MANANPEQFAKAVLWHLAGVRADLITVKTQIETVQMLLNKEPSKTERREFLSTEADVQLRLYKDACQQAGLPPGLPEAS